MEGTMQVVVTWWDGDRVLDEEQFEDLAEAQRYYFAAQDRFKALGATAGQVWNGGTTFFKVDFGNA
jgi:hypothetical protein